MAAATLVSSLLLTACRVLTPTPRLLVLATAFVPFAVVGYLVALLGAGLVRRLSSGRTRRAATVVLAAAVAGVLVHAGLLLPSYAGHHAFGRPGLTVLTSNLRLGLGDTATLTRVAEQGGADVVVLEEVTQAAYDRLARLRQDLPYQAGTTFQGARGTMVFSRYPLGQVSQLAVFQGAWLMKVAAPKPFWLVALHAAQPGSSFPLWRADHAALLSSARQVVRTGPVVMAGDFNATLDHRPVRRLLALGLSDAARESNAGWQPTWPGDPAVRHGLPLGLGLMAIDHVLVSPDFSAISTSTYRVTGSDHRALLARLAVR